MKCVKQLGNVVFSHNSLFVKEEMHPNTFSSNVRQSAAGSRIVWVQEVTTPIMTLQSNRNGWVTDAQREEIVNMYMNIGGVYSAVYDDGTAVDVSFAYEKPPVFTPVYEGSDYFTAEITLVKIN